jgi:hypothetical protein
VPVQLDHRGMEALSRVELDTGGLQSPFASPVSVPMRAYDHIRLCERTISYVPRQGIEPCYPHGAGFTGPRASQRSRLGVSDGIRTRMDQDHDLAHSRSATDTVLQEGIEPPTTCL